MLGCLESSQQLMRRSGDRRYRAIEGSFISLRRARRTAELPDELQRGVMDLVIRRRWIKVEQRFYVPAHFYAPGALDHRFPMWVGMRRGQPFSPSRGSIPTGLPSRASLIFST